MHRVPPPNFRLIPEVGDGACLFRSASRHIFGTPELHLNVRHAVNLYNQDRLAAETAVVQATQDAGDATLHSWIFSQNTTPAQYFSNMARAGTCGDEPELFAITQVFQLPVLL